MLFVPKQVTIIFRKICLPLTTRKPDTLGWPSSPRLFTKLLCNDDIFNYISHLTGTSMGENGGEEGFLSSLN